MVPPFRHRLAVLLPITSKGRCTAETATAWKDELLSDLTELMNSFGSQHVLDGYISSDGKHSTHTSNVSIEVLVGVDEDDSELRAILPDIEACFEHPRSPSSCPSNGGSVLDSKRCPHLSSSLRVSARAIIFERKRLDDLPPGPLCWMWNVLAQAAMQTHEPPDVLLLLGDDTELSPPGWPEHLLDSFSEDPSLMCLLLNDKADPGCPTFPAVRASHMHTFGQMLPDIFINQVGDPFLAALYRRVGALKITPDITVHNKVGGIQLPSDSSYVCPRYKRVYPEPGKVLQLLEDWANKTRAAGLGREATLTVDVLVPSYRAQVNVLEVIMEMCSRVDPNLNAEVRFGIVIDNPDCPESTRAKLLEVQSSEQWLGRLRLRFNKKNLGASDTRNKLLEESLAEYVVLLDDDIIPAPGMMDAYLRAFLRNPHMLGFAGPTLLPRPPTIVACGTHMSDITWFWDAPLAQQMVPWAVTANVAFKNSKHRFHTQFIKTGGGEDIDYCIRAAPGGLLSVPEAVVYHPLWEDGRPCFLRFAKWAYGDGLLVSLYSRQYVYTAAPTAAELMWAIIWIRAALSIVQLAVATATAMTASAGIVLPALLPSAGMVLPPASAMSGLQFVTLRAVLEVPWYLLAGAVVVAECLMDLGRNMLMKERYVKHPCPTLAVRAAASVYATMLRMCVDTGRIYGHLTRGQPQCLCHRFDWFCGTVPGLVKTEKWKSVGRLAGYMGFMGVTVLLYFCWWTR